MISPEKPGDEAASALTTTVLIPTYKRPDNLSRCFAALEKQSLQPGKVLVVRRVDDTESSAVIEDWISRLPLEEVLVEHPGVVNSLNKGLERVRTELVCILDDDTAPHIAWLERIVSIFTAQSDVGGLGGRDHTYDNGKLQQGSNPEVGIIRWYGRFVGNHHIGVGPARDVDYLKGANMSFRMSAVGDTRFDTRFLGRGAQVHNDLAFSLAVHNRGWRLLYDPEVAVDHFRGERFDSDQRGAPAMDAAENMACNFYLTLRDYVQPPRRRFMAILYAKLVGLRHSPGFLRALWYRLRANQDGIAFRAVALRAWQTARLKERRSTDGEKEGSQTMQPPDGIASLEPESYRFTICFCTRSRPVELDRALKSLLHSTRQIDQVIVSDDSVDNETQQMIATSFPDVLYLRGPRRGLGANRNRAVASATGTHVVYMDDDTALGERFVEEIVKAYQAVAEPLRPTTIISGLENQNGKLIEPSDLSFWGFVDQPRTAASRRPLHTAVINATSFPRDVFELIEFDENLIYGCEEVDICTQAIAKGYRFELCRTAINDHFHSQLHRNDYARYTTASRIYTTLKRHFYLQRSPFKAIAYLFLGPLKLALSELRRKGFRGVLQVGQSLSIAAGYARNQIRYLTSQKSGRLQARRPA